MIPVPGGPFSNTEAEGQLRCHPSSSSSVSLLKDCVNVFISGSRIPAHLYGLQEDWQAP